MGLLKAVAWVTSNDNYSIIVPMWERLRISDGSRRGFPVLAMAVVNEQAQTVQFFCVNRQKAVVDTAMQEIFKNYGFSAEGLKDWQQAGDWVATATLHPLHAAADKQLKAWLKTLDLASGVPVGEAKLKLPPQSVRVHNGVTYEGYTNRFLKAHSFGAVRKIVEDSLQLVKAAWGWEAKDLRVLTHNAGNAMGLAYSPGKGVHRISLHSKLINEYDTMSIFRVVLHELCHHYREERWPRPRGYLTGDSHDEHFCAALSLVDPVIRENAEQCRVFTDEQWEGSVVVQRKEAALKADRFDPERGFFYFRHLKSGQMRLDWEGSAFKKKGIKVGTEDLQKITADMTAAQQEALDVLPSDTRSAYTLTALMGRGGRVSLRDLLTVFERRYGIKGIVK